MKKAMMQNLISIIIPVYNAEQYLSQCLDSVINQSYQNIEILCVDDDSTDHSLSILQQYAKRDHRIVVIHKSNEGVSLARNTGLLHAKGDYILFVDSDDWIEPETCEIVLEKMILQNADVAMWSYVREWNGESKQKKIYDKELVFCGDKVRQKLHRRMIGLLGEELARPEAADALCTVWGKLYRRDIVVNNAIQFYDIREIGTYEDGLFNLFYFKHVEKAVYLSQYLYHYRKTNQTSITSSYNPNLWNQWKKLYSLMKSYIIENCDEESYWQALNNRISLGLLPLGLNIVSNRIHSAKEQILELKLLLKDDDYREAINTLVFEYFPIHWKIFFQCAKRQWAVGVYLLLVIIQKLRGR